MARPQSRLAREYRDTGGSNPVLLERVPDGLRTPRQERSRRSLERVLDAGAQVLAEHGWEGFTIADVARLANASSGLIYKRFENKAALFEAIMLREQDRIVADEDSRLHRVIDESEGAAAFLSGAVSQMAIVAYRESDLLRVFNERSALDANLLEYAKRGRNAPRLFTEAVLTWESSIAHSDPRMAADFAFWIANSAIDRRVSTPMWRNWRPGSENDWPEFVSELVHAVQAYLLVPPAQFEARGPKRAHLLEVQAAQDATRHHRHER